MKFCRFALTVIWLQQSFSCFTVTRDYKDTFNVFYANRDCKRYNAHYYTQKMCVCGNFEAHTFTSQNNQNVQCSKIKHLGNRQ